MLYTLLFGLIVLSDLATIQTAKRRFEVDLYNITCTNNSAHIKRFEFGLTKLAASRFVFNLNFMLDEDLKPDSEVHLIIEVTPPQGGRTLTFVNMKASVCEAVSKKYKTPLIKDLMDELRRSSNMPYSCPIKKNFMYKVRNYSITEELVPVYSPYINFTGILNVYQNKQFFIGGQMKGAIVPRIKK